MQTRNSNQRKIIMEIMKDNYTHPTADEIYEQARLVDVHISRGTVYRNLGLLSETGEILKISVPTIMMVLFMNIIIFAARTAEKCLTFLET